MPQLKFSGVETEKILGFSVSLVDELEQLLECPREYFTLERIHTTSILDGKIVEGYPYVEVSWFDRGQAVQDKAAAIITRKLIDAGCINVDVVFTILDKNRYYENGVHF